MRLSLNRQNKKSEVGVGFIEVAIVLPIVIFLLMGFIDFGIVMLGRYQMQSAATAIARQIQDAPRMTNDQLNTAVNRVLAGLDGQAATRSAGIQAFRQPPQTNWGPLVPAGARLLNPPQIQGLQNYWVGVVVRMNMRRGSFMSPYIRDLVPGNNYLSTALVPVRNILNCGPNRVMVSDNNGSYACGPDCGPGQSTIVSPNRQAVVCSVLPPVCTGQGVLQFDGTNFVCTQAGAVVGRCDQPGQVLRSNGGIFFCANLIVRNYEYAGQWGPHQNIDNCRNGYQCPAGSFVYYHEDNNNGGGASCRIYCAYPIVW